MVLFLQPRTQCHQMVPRTVSSNGALLTAKNTHIHMYRHSCNHFGFLSKLQVIWQRESFGTTPVPARASNRLITALAVPDDLCRCPAGRVVCGFTPRYVGSWSAHDSHNVGLSSINMCGQASTTSKASVLFPVQWHRRVDLSWAKPQLLHSRPRTNTGHLYIVLNVHLHTNCRRMLEYPRNVTKYRWIKNSSRLLKFCYSSADVVWTYYGICFIFHPNNIVHGVKMSELSPRESD